MKTSRVRTLFSLIWLIFTLSLITWWFIFAIRNLNLDDLTDSAKHYCMFYEGSTLLVTVLLGGIVMIGLSYRDDLRNEKIKFFFSNFTHEIKTSITRIRLQAEILIEEDTNKSISLIRYIDSNRWIPLIYFILTLSIVIFFQVRQKYFYLFCTMIIITIPCIYYSSFCLYIFNKSIF